MHAPNFPLDEFVATQLSNLDLAAAYLKLTTMFSKDDQTLSHIWKNLQNRI